MTDCSTCEAKRTQVPDNVPLFFHESAMAMAERTAKRLWITIVLLALLLVGTNGAWIWYESQFECCETTQEVTQQCNNGDNCFIGGDCVE